MDYYYHDTRTSSVSWCTGISLGTGNGGYADVEGKTSGERSELGGMDSRLLFAVSTDGYDDDRESGNEIALFKGAFNVGLLYIIPFYAVCEFHAGATEEVQRTANCQVNFAVAQSVYKV